MSNYLLVSNRNGSYCDEIVCEAPFTAEQYAAYLKRKGVRFDSVAEVGMPATTNGVTLTWLTPLGVADVLLAISEKKTA